MRPKDLAKGGEVIVGDAKLFTRRLHNLAGERGVVTVRDAGEEVMLNLRVEATGRIVPQGRLGSPVGRGAALGGGPVVGVVHVVFAQLVVVADGKKGGKVEGAGQLQRHVKLRDASPRAEHGAGHQQVDDNVQSTADPELNVVGRRQVEQADRANGALDEGDGVEDLLGHAELGVEEPDVVRLVLHVPFVGAVTVEADKGQGSRGVVVVVRVVAVHVV
mmetsp:Transcript_10928/g.34719  ORF Transcript_10928/g.34719 Transcript_10928/m.34719 type:complete len:218 (+) Transcript_10928:1509-2162(+)